ncbi:DNA-binding response regulator, OmpR family, contains REC and winged-helix (wHTH) domain [Lentzea waywayandensis]|uniref:DNA-binding response regulator, OmpR family, contains REC and winged-helix (WHTH) domain n=1 Tax=Lentzea waywayandensis TaxID=84724 RepID=A0A1I6FDC4_9PSEU|nr:response regulator transcription factor [Lentzea waywayandensis]SFR27843.1 DNA-binding response regulator, OmpR family, contains REC and winged-helix (wHTH) domain [Lentzea waywayandensis]
MTPVSRVLVIEDETSLADGLAEGLRLDGFEVETVADGLLGLDAGLTRAFDAIVLDLMLPGLPGLDLCAQLRRAGVRVPVLVLTARDGELDQLRALRIGADDFLTKPFSYRVLLARLHALLRRSGLRLADVLTAGDLALDRVARRCRRGETAIELTPREFALLELLMSRPGQVVSKRFALEEVWDSAIPVQSNVLEVYVAYLRRKIDLPFGRHAVETVRGAGYRLAADGG